MSFELREPTANLADSGNIVTLLKFYGINLLVSIVVGLLLMLIISMTGVGLIGHILVIGVILVSQLYAITTFEYYDGCYRKKE
jgi:uncharacterized membrane protein YkgB